MRPSLADDLTVPVDSLKAGTVLLGAYVVSLLYFVLPPENLLGVSGARAVRHLYSVLCSGLIFALLFSAAGLMELMVVPCLVYALCWYGRRSRITALVAFGLSMAHLSWNLLVTQVFSDRLQARFDVTAPLMVLVVKLTSFAWSVYDGTRPASELSKQQQEYAIRKYPSLIQFLGFVCFFPSFLVGPSFEFKDYDDFIARRKPFDKIPSRVWPVTRCLLYAVGMLYIYIRFGSTWNFDIATKPEFMEQPFWARLAWLQVYGFMSRTKYYGAWKLSEGACIIAGIGFNGYDEKGKPRWDRAENVDIFNLEFASNPQTMMGGWNKRTNYWLRNSVYLRLSSKPGQKPTGAATIVTYLVSAFWHGF
ncbi:lysophospholipid acyltransferase, partial [Irineochytrium annulatum]